MKVAVDAMGGDYAPESFNRYRTSDMVFQVYMVSAKSDAYFQRRAVRIISGIPGEVGSTSLIDNKATDRL